MFVNLTEAEETIVKDEDNKWLSFSLAKLSSQSQKLCWSRISIIMSRSFTSLGITGILNCFPFSHSHYYYQYTVQDYKNVCIHMELLKL